MRIHTKQVYKINEQQLEASLWGPFHLPNAVTGMFTVPGFASFDPSLDGPCPSSANAETLVSQKLFLITGFAVFSRGFPTLKRELNKRFVIYFLVHDNL